MRLSLIFLVSVAVAASGCSAFSGSMDPDQQFKSQVNDMRNSDFHVTYEVEANIGGYGDLISGAINKPEVYKNGDQSKFVVDVTGVTAAAYDILENRSAVCTQGSLLGGLGGGLGQSTNTEEESVSCEAYERESVSEEDIDEGLGNFSMDVTGTKTIADRECTNYRFEPSEDEINETLEDTDVPQTSSISQYSDSQINICLDSQKGYPALMNVKTNQSSELREDGMKELVRIEATEYDMEFEGVNMEVPVDIGAKMSCDPFQANITTFDYSGEVEISVNEEENMTRDVDSNSQISLNLSSDNKIDGTNEVIVSTGESTASASEYCYDYSSDFDLDTDYETDYNYSY